MASQTQTAHHTGLYELLERIKSERQRAAQDCSGLANLLTAGAFAFKLRTETTSGERTQTSETYWLIGRYEDIRNFNRVVRDPNLEKQAGGAYLRAGHRKIDPINRYNPRIVQLGNSAARDRRNPTDFQRRNVEALDSCHIVDDSLVRDLFAGLGVRPVQLEYHNLPCFSGTMHMNRYRDNVSVRRDDAGTGYFSGQRVNDSRREVLASLRSAGGDKDKKRMAWQLARDFVNKLYKDEPCLSQVADLILDYAAEKANLPK